MNIEKDLYMSRFELDREIQKLQIQISERNRVISLLTKDTDNMKDRLGMLIREYGNRYEDAI